MTNGELLQALRVDVVCEMESIISYEAHAMSTTDDRVKKVLYQLADEEKQHVGRLQQLIYFLSPRERQHFEQGRQNQKRKFAQDSAKLV